MEKSVKAREILIGQYIQELFPDLKYKIIDWDENGIREQHLMESGVYPDLFFGTDKIVKGMRMNFDLRPLIFQPVANERNSVSNNYVLAF